MNDIQKRFSVVVAGSTERTLLCAKALSEDPRFEIVGVLTPSPRPIGRKQIITKNPMHQWAEVNQIPTILIEKKIDASIQELMHSQFSIVNFLLVVDFGYIVPQWLLDFPSIAPINIHPSKLPSYRGSSPAQFALIFGEKESAVTIMVMDALLDHGPIITKFPFEVGPTWTASGYYEYAFSHVVHKLPEVFAGFADTRHSTPQPDVSPTPTARMLTRDDGFISHQTLVSLLNQETPKEPVAFLEKYQRSTNNENVFNLWRGLTPWPGLWTVVDGKRMKLLSFHMDGQKLILDEIQMEGEKPKKY